MKKNKQLNIETKKIISFELDHDLYENIRKYAYDRHQTLSSAIRNILKEKLSYGKFIDNER